MKARFFGVLLLAGVATSAYGTPLVFNFNSLAENSVSGTPTTANSIAKYLTTTLQANGCVGCTVTVAGAIADTTYNGESHVTGPGTAVGKAAKSLTLGTSDNATMSNTTSTLNSSYDTFIANTSDASGNIASQINLVFTGITITAASFDYEIFPDGTCPILNSANCGGGTLPNQPDLTFTAGTFGTGGPADTAVTTFGTNGVQKGITPGSGSDGNAVKSPNSSTELAPQYIGTWTGSLNNVTDLNFIDWPATIGIDNLSITYTIPTKGGASPVPEPGSVLLLGTVVGGLLLLGKRMRKA